MSVLFSIHVYAGKPVASVSDTTIANGVIVEGVDLSGMTPDEARAALQAKADSLAATSVNLRLGENVITSTLADLGYSCTNLDIVDSLIPIGKSGNIVERYKEQKDLENETVQYALDFTVDLTKVQAFVQNCSVYNSDPVEGELLVGDDGYPYVEGGTKGINVENGCSLINGTLLWPGDEFSVTEAVTPFSAENGYMPAPTYEENRTIDSYGGGICQVSTTLYNAALKAEMDITARSNHTMMVNYVEPSKDAAIAACIRTQHRRLDISRRRSLPIRDARHSCGSISISTVWKRMKFWSMRASTSRLARFIPWE